jgi:hypothetical protein
VTRCGSLGGVIARVRNGDVIDDLDAVIEIIRTALIPQS